MGPIFSACNHSLPKLSQFLDTIKSSNTQSSPGPDAPVLASTIYDVYSSLSKGKVHHKLLDSRLTMIKKPGFDGDPKDLRPIAVTNTFLRIIQRAIAYKISTHIASKITFHQKGFLKYRYIGECVKNVQRHIAHLHKG